MLQIKIVFYLQGQDHSEGSYDQNMTLSAIFSELLILQQPNMVLMIHHHKPECLLKKNLVIAFKVKVIVKGQKVHVCPFVIF